MFFNSPQPDQSTPVHLPKICGLLSHSELSCIDTLQARVSAEKLHFVLRHLRQLLLNGLPYKDNLQEQLHIRYSSEYIPLGQSLLELFKDGAKLVQALTLHDNENLSELVHIKLPTYLERALVLANQTFDLQNLIIQKNREELAENGIDQYRDELLYLRDLGQDSETAVELEFLVIEESPHEYIEEFVNDRTCSVKEAIKDCLPWSSAKKVVEGYTEPLKSLECMFYGDAKELFGQICLNAPDQILKIVSECIIDLSISLTKVIYEEALRTILNLGFKVDDSESLADIFETNQDFCFLRQQLEFKFEACFDALIISAALPYKYLAQIDHVYHTNQPLILTTQKLANKYDLNFNFEIISEDEIVKIQIELSNFGFSRQMRSDYLEEQLFFPVSYESKLSVLRADGSSLKFKAQLQQDLIEDPSSLQRALKILNLTAEVIQTLDLELTVLLGAPQLACGGYQTEQEKTIFVNFSSSYNYVAFETYNRLETEFKIPFPWSKAEQHQGQLESMLQLKDLAPLKMAIHPAYLKSQKLVSALKNLIANGNTVIIDDYFLSDIQVVKDLASILVNLEHKKIKGCNLHFQRYGFYRAILSDERYLVDCWAVEIVSLNTNLHLIGFYDRELDRIALRDLSDIAWDRLALRITDQLKFLEYKEELKLSALVDTLKSNHIIIDQQLASFFIRSYLNRNNFTNIHELSFSMLFVYLLQDPCFRVVFDQGFYKLSYGD